MGQYFCRKRGALYLSRNTWKMQYEEFSEFNQKNPEKVISLEQKESMAIFMEQYLENQRNKSLENSGSNSEPTF